MARTKKLAATALHPMTSTRVFFGVDYAAAVKLSTERQSLGITSQVYVERGTDPKPYEFCYVLEAN